VGVFKCLAILHFKKKKVYFLRRKKEELWKLKYISPCKNILIFPNPKLKKKKKNHPLKERNQNPSQIFIYITLVTNLSSLGFRV
jgi:hypothetical protein